MLTLWSALIGVAGAQEPDPTPMTHRDLEVRKRVDPSYPKPFADGDLRCIAEVTLSPEGTPESIEVRDCPERFQAATADALMKWRWYPPKVRAITKIAVVYRRGTSSSAEARGVYGDILLGFGAQVRDPEDPEPRTRGAIATHVYFAVPIARSPAVFSMESLAGGDRLANGWLQFGVGTGGRRSFLETPRVAVMTGVGSVRRGVLGQDFALTLALPLQVAGTVPLGPLRLHGRARTWLTLAEPARIAAMRQPATIPATGGYTASVGLSLPVARVDAGGPPAFGPRLEFTATEALGYQSWMVVLGAGL